MRFCIILLVALFHFLPAGAQPCYFQRDTGTAEIETSYSAVELNDGTIYVTGSQGNGPHGAYDVPLIKFNACGDVLWIKYFGDSLDNDAYYINKTADQHLLVAGQTGTAANSSDAEFYIMDSSGNVSLHRLYGAQLDERFTYVEQTSDKGFIFCGYVSDAFGSNDHYVVKVDSAGTIQWQAQIGTPGIESADMIHELPDGNFLMSGDTKTGTHSGFDVELIKLDRYGNVIWDKIYGDTLENGCQGVWLLSNGNYLSYGETNVPGSVGFDFFIEMIDTAGNTISRHTFGGTAADALFSLTEIPGMDFICTGYSRSFNGFAAYDIVLFRVDSAGNMKWLKNIYSPGVDIGYKLIPSLYGDYIVTGLMDVNNYDYFLTRTDTIANTNVGIHSVNDIEDFRLYPSPATDYYTLENPCKVAVSCEFMSVMGTVLERFIIAPGKTTVHVQNYASGVYYLRISPAHGAPAVERLLINR